MALTEYRNLVRLDESFHKSKSLPENEAERASLITKLLDFLISESGERVSVITYREKRDLLYSLLTVREPLPLPAWFNEDLDKILQWELTEKSITDAHKLAGIYKAFPSFPIKGTETCVLWQGDITTLEIDAIVNAANSALIGCFRPFHKCIDNVINSASGPRLREDCHTIIQKQGCPEGTGWAKITRAYNLPSKYILHTVGPIIKEPSGSVTPEQKSQLASCYESCLNLTAQVSSIKSIAFCTVSTGVFGFPKELASRIAIQSVEKWIEENPERMELILFNVFMNEDLEIYKKHLL